MAHEGNIKLLCKYILLRSLNPWTMRISDTLVWISALLSLCGLLGRTHVPMSNWSISVSRSPEEALIASKQGEKSKKKECSRALSAEYKNYCTPTYSHQLSVFLPFLSRRAAFAMFSTMYFLLASEILSKQAAKRNPSLEEAMVIFLE